MTSLNKEFVVDLVLALRGEPERARDLLLSDALAGILERLLDRIASLEHALSLVDLEQRQLAQRQMVVPLPYAGQPAQQWHQDMALQLQNLKQMQDLQQAQMAIHKLTRPQADVLYQGYQNVARTTGK
jgi:hypothetical protein